MTAPYYARDEFTGDGTTRVFAISWPYLSQLDVTVTVNDGSYTGSVTWTDDTHVSLGTVPANASKVAIFRTTPLVASDDKGITNRQLLYAAQELSDTITHGVVLVPGESVGTAPYTIFPYGTTARSNSDRFGEIVDPMEMGGYFNGHDDDIPALNLAIAEVHRRGRGIIKCPAGSTRWNSPLDLRPLHGMSFALDGMGSGITQIILNHNAGPTIYHGDATKFGSGRTPTARISGFGLLNNIGSLNAGNAFLAMAACDEFEGSDWAINVVHQLLIIGGDVNADSVYRANFKGIYASENTDTTSSFIEFRSCSIVNFEDDCFFNGSGYKTLFAQPANAVHNADGITVGRITAEQWDSLLEFVGPGGGNFNFIGGHSDRPGTHAVRLAPLGDLRQVNFIGWIFEGHESTTGLSSNTTRGIIMDTTGGAIYGVKVADCDMFGFGGNGIDINNSTGTLIHDNRFRNVACNAGITPAVIQVGATGSGIIHDNYGTYRDYGGGIGASSYYRGINWAGSTSIGRQEHNNIWAGVTNANAGTP